MVPQEHRTWNNEDPPKDIFSRPQITLANYTPNHGPHLSRNSVTHQDRIYSRYLENQLHDTTDGRRTDGRTQMNERGGHDYLCLRAFPKDGVSKRPPN